MIESVSACGWSCTADSTATRGRVTRSATPLSSRSKSEVVGTLRSIEHLLESVKISSISLPGHAQSERAGSAFRTERVPGVARPRNDAPFVSGTFTSPIMPTTQAAMT